MSNKKDQSTPLTASEINKDISGVKEEINSSEDKLNKLAELVNMNISFPEWEKKDLNITEKPKIDTDAILAKQEEERKARQAEEARRLAEEEAARKAAEEKAAKEAEEARKAAEEAAKEEIQEEPVQEEVVEPVKEEVVVEVKEEPKPEPVKEEKKQPAKPSRKQFNKKPQPQDKNKVSFTGYFEKVVGVKKISKTTKGGRHMRFSALVIIGDKNGIVGYGKGKSIEVPVAIRKALKNAKNNLRKVKINKNGTLFHEVIGKQGAGKVLIKPAPIGTGIIAGGPIRVVLELAGYKDVYSKNLGKNTSMNMVLATLNGLSQIRSPKEVAFLRDKELKDL